MGFPIPEDLLLLAAGYLIYTGSFQWPLALCVSALGVVVSDLMLYSFGRRLAWRSVQMAEGSRFSSQRLERTTQWFAGLGYGVILVARLRCSSSVM